MTVLILGHDEVIASLAPSACAEEMASVLAAHARGAVYMPLRSVMMPPDAAGFMGLMPAWRDEHHSDRATFALKAICIMPGNPARGLDAHQGTVTLFDGETGVPSAILDASAITAIRTAAVSAVATRVLAREDARVLAIIGAGVQARTHIDALLRVRGFESVCVYAPTEAHAQAVVESATATGAADAADAADAAEAGSVEFAVAPTARDAVVGADVVVTVTSSREPVIERGWLGPGTHINAVGASTPAARELDTDTVAASALFCDSRESLLSEAGEFQLADREGKIAGEDHIRAELGEVLAGRLPGRRSHEELTLFRSLGLAAEDLAAAAQAVATARSRGLGREVEL